VFVESEEKDYPVDGATLKREDVLQEKRAIYEMELSLGDSFLIY